MPRTASLACAAAVCSLIAAAIPHSPTQARISELSPSLAQCHANLAPDSVYFNTCPANTRSCPNYQALGVSRCLEQTPAERAAAEREIAMNKARDDARRILEQERLRLVEQETARLGAHRREEAIRLIEQRRRAEEARGQAERAEDLAQRLAAMSPQDRAAYERCREIARQGRVTCQ
ncbi:hypothetical protein [Brevundimonas sp. Marseille-Q4549]